MQRKRKCMGLVIMSCLMVLVMAMTAFADYPAIDMDRAGSITVTMNTRSDGSGTPVGGGQMTVFQVADVKMDYDAEGYCYVVLDPYIGSSYDFEGRLEGETGDSVDIDWPRLAQDFSDYVYEKEITGVTKDINASGVVTFDGLYPGLYLLVQTEPAEGYYAANPFLVSMPTYNGDLDYSYTVDASPKTEVFPGPVKDVDVDIEDDKSYGDDGVEVSVGQVLTYKVTYINNRVVPASVSVIDELDPNVEYVEGSAVPEAVFIADDSAETGGTLTWTISDVPARESGEVTFQVTVLSSAETPEEVDNDASVSVGGSSYYRTNIVRNPVTATDIPTPETDDTPTTPTTNRTVTSGGGSNGGGVRPGTNSGPGADSGTSGSGDSTGSDSSSSIHDVITSDEIGELPATGESNMSAILLGLCAVFVVLLAVLFYMRRRISKDQL